MAWLSLLHLHLLMLGLVCCIPQDYTRVSRSELEKVDNFTKIPRNSARQKWFRSIFLTLLC